jgi:two-component system, chemotaxis family, chemotaxis protein CheY
MERRGRLLLVEDEEVLRKLIAQFLRGQGFDVIEAADGAEAIRLLDEAGTHPIEVVLLDLNLPQVHGVDVARHLRRGHPALPVVICSAAIVSEHAATLRSLGIERFLTKPYHPEMLLEAIDQERQRGSACDLVTAHSPSVT